MFHPTESGQGENIQDERVASPGHMVARNAPLAIRERFHEARRKLGGCFVVW